jgi:uncharacterized membrane protein YeaQ/YmgE (transglycosylase-associated protein family)
VWTAPQRGTPSCGLTPSRRRQGARAHHQCHRRRAHHRGARPTGGPRPAGPVDLVTIAIGIVAALIGSLIASALGVGETSGIDWIKLIIQVALAALGVALVVGRFSSGRRRL